ncbi:Type cbb3 cytochrome oxidase biogenesis protein CcoG, involved in Cu oxidation, partial [hydrothermal vent metagenome]
RELRAAGKKEAFNLIRPRTILYAFVLGFVAVLITYGLSERATIELNVLRDRTPPFVQLSSGSIRNAYTVKILNKANEMRNLVLTVDAPDGAQISAIGETVEDGKILLNTESDAVHSMRLFITLPQTALTKSSIPVTISILDPQSGEEAVNPTVFLSEGK